MADPIQLFCFYLKGQRYGLHLNLVERVLRAVEVTPLPGAPEVVMGMVDVHGDVLPVINLHKRFGFADKPLEIDHQMIIARTSRRRLILWVDSTEGVIEVPQERVLAGDRIVAGLEQVEGVARLDNDLILIHDLNRCLSLDDERVLDCSMEGT